MADTISPRQLAERASAGLKIKLGLTDAQVYVSAFGGYVEGQNLQTIQVVFGGTQPKGAGSGAQDGGGLLRDERIVLWCWFTLNLSMHGLTQAELITVSAGVLDQLEKIRAVFALTTLGGVAIEPLVYGGTSPVTVFDEDKGVFFATIVYTAAIGEYLPDAATLTAADFA